MSKSSLEEVPELVWHPWSCSLAIWNEEGLLDIPFSVEEVKRVVGKLKKRKAAGPDSILAEHLIAGGDAVDLWLNEVLNAMVEMEKIPDVLKCGVEILIYKGSGKDTLNTNTYRGVTLTSVIAKVLAA